MRKIRPLRPGYVDPADLRVIRAGDTAPGQFFIQNAEGSLEDFDKHYVHISGFCGIHSPHTFAMAPKLLEQLEFAVKLLGAFPALSGSSQVASMAETVALAKQEPTP